MENKQQVNEHKNSQSSVCRDSILPKDGTAFASFDQNFRRKYEAATKALTDNGFVRVVSSSTAGGGDAGRTSGQDPQREDFDPENSVHDSNNCTAPRDKIFDHSSARSGSILPSEPTNINDNVLVLGLVHASPTHAEGPSETFSANDIVPRERNQPLEPHSGHEEIPNIDHAEDLPKFEEMTFSPSMQQLDSGLGQKALHLATRAARLSSSHTVARHSSSSLDEESSCDMSISSGVNASEILSNPAMKSSKPCEYCRSVEASEVNPMVRCVRCRRRYHTSCHKPAVTLETSVARWRCQLCTEGPIFSRNTSEPCTDQNDHFRAQKRRRLDFPELHPPMIKSRRSPDIPMAFTTNEKESVLVSEALVSSYNAQHKCKTQSPPEVNARSPSYANDFALSHAFPSIVGQYSDEPAKQTNAHTTAQEVSATNARALTESDTAQVLLDQKSSQGILKISKGPELSKAHHNNTIDAWFTASSEKSITHNSQPVNQHDISANSANETVDSEQQATALSTPLPNLADVESPQPAYQSLAPVTTTRLKDSPVLSDILLTQNIEPNLVFQLQDREESSNGIYTRQKILPQSDTFLEQQRSTIRPENGAESCQTSQNGRVSNLIAEASCATPSSPAKPATVPSTYKEIILLALKEGNSQGRTSREIFNWIKETHPEFKRQKTGDQLLSDIAAVLSAHTKKGDFTRQLRDGIFYWNTVSTLPINSLKGSEVAPDVISRVNAEEIDENNIFEVNYEARNSKSGLKVVTTKGNASLTSWDLLPSVAEAEHQQEKYQVGEVIFVRVEGLDDESNSAAMIKEMRKLPSGGVALLVFWYYNYAQVMDSTRGKTSIRKEWPQGYNLVRTTWADVIMLGTVDRKANPTDMVYRGPKIILVDTLWGFVRFKSKDDEAMAWAAVPEEVGEQTDLHSLRHVAQRPLLASNAGVEKEEQASAEQICASKESVELESEANPTQTFSGGDIAQNRWISKRKRNFGRIEAHKPQPLIKKAGKFTLVDLHEALGISHSITPVLSNGNLAFRDGRKDARANFLRPDVFFSLE